MNTNGYSDEEGPMYFRKKPVVIQAIRWTGENPLEVERFITCQYLMGREIIIQTLEGDLAASVGDWIIKGVKGEFYPCKPDIFELTYEQVDGPE